MAIGVTDYVWSIGELIQKALDAPTAPAPIAPPPLTRPTHYRGEGLPADRKPFKLTVVQGGRVGKRHQNRNQREPGA